MPLPSARHLRLRLAASAGLRGVRVSTGIERVVGRALAALRSYGSPAVPSWAVRGAQALQPRS
jgi:hypothetical protein